MWASGHGAFGALILGWKVRRLQVSTDMLRVVYLLELRAHSPECRLQVLVIPQHSAPRGEAFVTPTNHAVCRRMRIGILPLLF